MIVEISNNCSNDSSHTFFLSASDYNTFFTITIILSIVGTLTNGLSLFIFIVEKQCFEPILRLLLILLSISEIVFNCGWVFSDAATHALFYKRAEPGSIMMAKMIINFMIFSWIVRYTFFYCRNWCCLLIALSQSEAVVRPMSGINQRKIITTSRLQIFCCVIIFVSASCYTAHVLQFEYGLCTAAGWRLHDVRYKINLVVLYDIFIWCEMIFLRILPICTVSICLLLITRALRSNSCNVILLNNNSSDETSKRSTRMVQILLLVFVIMEFSSMCLTIAGTEFSESYIHVTEIGNILVCVDSIFNFVIYISMSKSFRRTTTHLLYLSPMKWLRNRQNVIGLGNLQDETNLMNDCE